jgi:hypothetical protein
MNKPALIQKPAEQLSEVEQLKMELITLRAHYLQQQLQITQNDRTALIKVVEDNHPGYGWDEQTGTLREVNKDAQTAAM